MHFRVQLALGCLFVLITLTGARSATSEDRLREADTLVQEVEAQWTFGNRSTIETKLQDALAIRKQLLGPDHALVGDVLGRLGRNAWNKDDYTAAENWFRQALTIEQRAEPESFNTARLLGDLGATLRERHNYEEAETLVRRSIAMRRRLFPPTEPFIAAGLDNLARVLMRQHRYTEARTAAVESLSIRYAAFGPNHEVVRQSKRLLDGLEIVLDPWRIVHYEGWIILVCALGLNFLVARTVYVERRAIATASNVGNESAPGFAARNVVWLEWFQLIVVIGCAGVAGYGAYIAADVLLPFYLPDLGSRNLHKLNVGAAMLGFGAFFVLLAWTSNLARRAFGLPLQFVIKDSDIRHAIFVGRLWVSWPVGILLVGSLGGLFYEVSQLSGGDLKGWIVLPIVLATVVVGVIPAWLWWSITIPRWQVWAMRRVTNLDGLFAHAIAARLLHPQHTRLGRLCTRTELWTPGLWREAQTIVAAAQAKTESSADMR